MVIRRLLSGPLLLLVAALGLAGCEPYLSMTDRVPAQTRKATALLPESPRYAGMVDLETVMTRVDELKTMSRSDNLRQASERLKTFLDATGMSPRTDLKAVYGALGKEAFSAVVFADLTPTQLDRYLGQASGEAGRATTYRYVPLYHLAGPEDLDDGRPADTLSLGFVQGGMIAVAMAGDRVKDMIDRYQEQETGLRASDPYMKLVEQVGHGSTAWLVGRNVLQNALRDSAEKKTEKGAAPSSRRTQTAEAGVQRVLRMWSDRVLGLSEAPSSFGEEASGKLKRLQSQVREQAVSVTLTNGTVEGELYLTMQDEASASNVADIARGTVAAMKISGEETTNLRQDFLDEVRIERNGTVVRVQFAVERERLRKTLGTA